MEKIKISLIKDFSTPYLFIPKNTELISCNSLDSLYKAPSQDSIYWTLAEIQNHPDFFKIVYEEPKGNQIVVVITSEKPANMSTDDILGCLTKKNNFYCDDRGIKVEEVKKLYPVQEMLKFAEWSYKNGGSLNVKAWEDSK